jgi:hypothetical protein
MGETFEPTQTAETRSTVSSVPPVVGVLVGAELTVDRVSCFVLVTALAVAAGCDRDESGKPTASATPTTSAPQRSCTTKCKLAGLCRFDAERDRCVAESSDKCAASNSCLTSGLCDKEGSVCVGTKPEHCKASQRCKSHGLCTFVGKGIFPCKASGDDCEASTGCKRHGRCTVVSGECQVASDADCAKATLCTEHGQCSAKPSWRGNVTVRKCAALSNDDCKKGRDCTEHDLCTAANGVCR